ncbi:MAG: hypothetical protein F6K30_17145 [Cyanothece sp. SIO2G6]|nr:hypothetical protein [Cyanothece sp. SIO2G6]
MGTRFHYQSIHQPWSLRLLTSMTAIAFCLICGNGVAVAQSQPQSQPNPELAPTDKNEGTEPVVGEGESNNDADVIDPDANTADVGLEVESPLDGDLEAETAEEGRLEGVELEEDIPSELPEVLELDGLELDGLELDGLELDELELDELELDELELDELDNVDIDDLNVNDLEADPDTIPEINIDDLQVDDLNEALDNDITPPLLDILENGIDLEVESPNTVPNVPPNAPPRPPSRPFGIRPAFGGIPLFENVVLTPNGMANPTVVRGISGGPLTAGQVAGRAETATGICTGFVDREPDHQIELTAFFDYLSLQVESPADTVLVVRGPGGSWCNDDVIGFNPGLVGEWFSGTYDVWVGSYNANTYHPYIIRLTDIQTGN